MTGCGWLSCRQVLRWRRHVGGTGILFGECYSYFRVILQMQNMKRCPMLLRFHMGVQAPSFESREEFWYILKLLHLISIWILLNLPKAEKMLRIVTENFELRVDQSVYYYTRTKAGRQIYIWFRIHISKRIIIYIFCSFRPSVCSRLTFYWKEVRSCNMA
jgi:hypothetical protein